MSAKVVQMPASTNFTVEQALDSAKTMGLTEVLILGYDADGDFCTRSSRMSRRDALWLAEYGRMSALRVLADE